ncbi:MAG TPA: mersacidin/lichenicidin family type 2 lantibiotic [Thermoanaerobaculia bacterium]|jgi:mersacidin/lichenicidin family type 2 lantibiotic|nr:mersacidin/lichenicidin family type 2 lantibiotic [Thermoanaerobaculia bacterium]
MEKEIVRAWKDPLYRQGLETPVLHPAGVVELTDEDLKRASGMLGVIPPQTTADTCTFYTFRGWTACGCGA